MNVVSGPKGEECYVEDNTLKVTFPDGEKIEFEISEVARDKIFDRQPVMKGIKSIGFFHFGAVTIMKGGNTAVFNEAEFLSLF